MTATPTPAPARPGRPVLGLVALAGSLLLLLGAIWWTGAVAVRARVHTASASGSGDATTGWAHASFEITNDGRFPVEVESVEVRRDREPSEVQRFLRDPDVAPELRSYPVDPSGMVGRTDLVEFEPFELPGGSSREVVLLFEVRCPGDWPTDVVVEASSRAGVTRSLRLGGPPLGEWSTPNGC